MTKSFPMNKMTLWLALVVVSSVALLWFFLHRGMKHVELSHTASNTPLYEPGDKPSKAFIKGVQMDNGRLFNMAITIYLSKSRVNQMRQVLAAFMNGPRTGKDQVPVPEGLKVNEFYFTPQGTAVVDIATDGLKPGEFGFYEEVLFIRGLIESLSQNFFEIKQVKVLVDGKESPTLGGHYALGTADLGVASKSAN